MTRLIVISGPANSGKLPLALKLCQDDPSLILVHRDRLRDAMFNQIDEGCLTLAMGDLARGLLMRGVGVVCCAQNMHPEDRKRWEGVWWETGAELTWLDTRDPEVHEMIPPLVGWKPATFSSASDPRP